MIKLLKNAWWNIHDRIIPERETKIRDYQHFAKLSHTFDQRYDTETLWCTISLQDI